MSDNVNPSEDNSFETALKQLEALVKSMESGNLPLSELVTSYEKGVSLMQQCEKQLEAAELRIQSVSKDAAAVNGVPFDPTI